VGSVEAGTLIAGKYRLERPLAKGGMGAVWIARHIHLDVVVAIKVMEPGYASSDDGRVRFEREAKGSAKLKSPHIVHVYDYGVDNDMPYLAMDLLKGEDLEARLKREGRLSLEATSALLAQIGKGLRVAHDAGLVHRDLKPGNIFLAVNHEGEEVAKILDFGIAKSVTPGVTKDATQTGAIIGSPRYMSPEQVRNSKRVDHRSDLWSLGVILFRCVTGRLPFAASEVATLILEICAEPIPTPSSIAPDLGPAVDRFFARALARNPDERFQSAREVAEAFAALAGDRLSSADWSDQKSRERVAPGLPGSGPAPQEAPGSTQSLSISEMKTLVRGASATGDSGAGLSSGNLSSSEAARSRAAGGASRGVLLALAALLVVAVLAGVALLRRGSAAQENARPEGAAPPSGPAAGLSPPPSAASAAAPTITPAGTAAPEASASAPEKPVATSSVAPRASGASAPKTPGRPVKSTGAGSDPQNPPLGF
jgi:serine/threonine-protein kinase